MNVTEQITKLSQGLPPGKQTEVLDFVEFLVSRQTHKAWTVEERWAVVVSTMGCLADTCTSSNVFAERKKEEKAKEERQWKS